MAYTREKLLEKVDAVLVPKKVSTLYKRGFVNYTGTTTDTKEKYTEVIAEHLLSNLGALKKIESITRERSYKTASHKWHPIDPESPRTEEQIARNMMYKTYKYIGKIVDYQTPLKNVQDDNAGKIDLLSRDEAKGRVYIIEFKAEESKETLLRCILEIATYYHIVDSEKLLSDFDFSGSSLRKAVLVYRLSLPHIRFRDIYVRKLMKALEVDLFVLDKNNNVVEAHYFEELEV